MSPRKLPPNMRFQSDGLAKPILRVSSGYQAISIYGMFLRKAAAEAWSLGRAKANVYHYL